MNKIIRRFFSFVLVATPLVACSMGPDDTAQIDKDTAATESALSLAKTPPPPTADGKIVTGGTSKGLFCTLCEDQGCICNSGGDACIECGLHLTATQPREP